jgi:hypothetical protein
MCKYMKCVHAAAFGHVIQHNRTQKSNHAKYPVEEVLEGIHEIEIRAEADSHCASVYSFD